MVSIVTALILQLALVLSDGQKPVDKTKATETKPPVTAVVNGGTGQWVGE